MAKIAIINNSPEIVALVAQALTVGNHEFLKLIGATDFMLQRVLDFAPDLIVLPLHRRQETASRAIQNYHHDVLGTDVLEMVANEPALKDVPIILFGFFTTEADIPDDYRRQIRYDEFLVFPTGLQELNPIISGRIGPAKSTPDDLQNVRRRKPFRPSDAPPDA